MKILVTGVGSTLGFGILQCLKKIDFKAEIFGTDYMDSAAGLYCVDHSYILPDIYKNSNLESEWLMAIKKLISKENIDFLFVGLDFEVPFFAKYKEELEAEFDCRVIVSSPRVVEICNDKWLTYLFLVENGFAVPRSCLPADVQAFRNSVPFPWIIKPRVGSTSNDLFKVNSKEELDFALINCKNAIIQEEIGSMKDEFTCGVVSFESEIISSIALRRTLKNGNTQMAIYEENIEIDNYIRKIAMSLGGFGPINIQLRLTNEGPKVFEINPRFSGTTAVRAQFGLNEVELLMKHLSGEYDFPKPILKEGVVLRPPSEMFVSLSQFASSKRL
jgi:carbamoyl-phosphate synthase large subunit